MSLVLDSKKSVSIDSRTQESILKIRFTKFRDHCTARIDILFVALKQTFVKDITCMANEYIRLSQMSDKIEKNIFFIIPDFFLSLRSYFLLSDHIVVSFLFPLFRYHYRFNDCTGPNVFLYIILHLTQTELESNSGLKEFHFLNVITAIWLIVSFFVASVIRSGARQRNYFNYY